MTDTVLRTSQSEFKKDFARNQKQLRIMRKLQFSTPRKIKSFIKKKIHVQTPGKITDIYAT